MRPSPRVFPRARTAKLGFAALVLALATSAAVANRAFADAAPVCEGRDLSESAEIKPDFAAHADDLVNGEGLLWKVEKPGLAPSYLYGTIHSTNSAAVALAKQAAAYLEGAKSVATELGGPMDATAKVDLSSGMLRAALSPAEDSLAGAMPAEDVNVVDRYMSAHGYPKEMAHHLALWFLAVAASEPACETEGAQQGLPEVDEYIAGFARDHGLPVVALETVAEQMRTLTSVPRDLAATMLLATARAPRMNDDAYATLLALYIRKRPAFATAILDALPGLTARERVAEDEFTRLLLFGRNEAMMQRMAPLLEKGGAFVAVGALHLSGKDGLIERARAENYRVTKVW